MTAHILILVIFSRFFRKTWSRILTPRALWGLQNSPCFQNHQPTRPHFLMVRTGLFCTAEAPYTLVCKFQTMAAEAACPIHHSVHLRAQQWHWILSNTENSAAWPSKCSNSSLWRSLILPPCFPTFYSFGCCFYNYLLAVLNLSGHLRWGNTHSRGPYYIFRKLSHISFGFCHTTWLPKAKKSVQVECLPRKKECCANPPPPIRTKCWVYRSIHIL